MRCGCCLVFDVGWLMLWMCALVGQAGAGLVSHCPVSARHVQGITMLWTDMMSMLPVMTSASSSGGGHDDDDDYDYEFDDDDDDAFELPEPVERRDEKYDESAHRSRVEALLQRAKRERRQQRGRD